ncbi:metal ABC transporter ATP-binding protein [Desulfosediminicola flagellatus]|uniref:metal ABC transporter ATP-binding protein n=1 Tax=Desulfosediminicola flagellatus TaxID=2569541 RepID=UPI001E5324DE|nr:ABC transporter ATP-binding protein [Desulfosediminicola flagellatus]
MEKEQAAITISDLAFNYGGREILTDVNLTIRPFDSICIVGPNGGGKTTLMKLIIGLLNPVRGEVLIFGDKPEDAKQKIGYVPQYAEYDKQFPISVKEVVCMGRLGNSFTGRYSKVDWEHTMNALAEVGLESFAESPFSALSGGQRQRVLIARALASGGELLILDEPTANIDQESESQFFELLRELNERMTILMVTHDVGFASKFFKRIACVNRRVVIHPTSELTGQLIKEMYGGDFQMIRHDHTCSEEGHHHD